MKALPLAHETRLTLFAVLLMGSAAPPVAAAIDVPAAVTFFEARQNPDGSFGGGPLDIASIVQASAAVAETLTAEAPGSVALPAARGFLTASAPIAIEHVARVVAALQRLGGPVPPSLIQRLSDARRPDGGWAPGGDFESEVIDTVFALRGLARAGALTDVVRTAGVTFLLGQQRPDGAWAVNDDVRNDGSVYVTALVVLTLTELPDGARAGKAVDAAGTWLVSQANPDDGSLPEQLGSVFETALGYRALIRSSGVGDVREHARDYLAEQQEADGSWNHETFSTALALEAIAEGDDAPLGDHIQTIDVFKVSTTGEEPATIFGAYETGAIRIGADDPDLVFRVAVRCADGSAIETTMLGGTFRFETANVAPGQCTVRVQAVDSTRGIVRDTDETTLTITPTVAISELTLVLSPSFSHLGATETVALAVVSRNHSNVPVSGALDFQVEAPDGSVLEEGSVPLMLPEGDAPVATTLTSFEHTFDQAGPHAVRVAFVHAGGVIAEVSGAIDVAQPLRIEPSKTLVPSVVPPGPGARVRVDIQLDVLGGGGSPPIETQVFVPGTANVFGAGHAMAPGPSGGGGGTLPPVVSMPTSGGRVVTIASATGSASCHNDQDPAPPDGGHCGGGGVKPGTDILSFGGISGIRDDDATMFLIGVFVDASEPSDPAPSRLDFTGDQGFSALAPELRQVFFIGDGMTGSGNGPLQRFIVPAGATRLFLGFADAFDFGAPTNEPGYYDDNTGGFNVTVVVEDATP